MKRIRLGVDVPFHRRASAFALDKVKLLLAVGGVIVVLFFLALMVAVVYWFYSYSTANRESAKEMAIAEADNYSVEQRKMGMYELKDSVHHDKDGNPKTYEELYGSQPPSINFRLTRPKLLSADDNAKVYKFSFFEGSSGERYLAVVRFHPIVSEVCIVSQSGTVVVSNGWETRSAKDCLK